MPGNRDEDGYLYEPYVFESTVTQPDGIRVHVSISVPPSAAWKDVQETAEIAQMTASRAISQITANKERCPF